MINVINIYLFLCLRNSKINILSFVLLLSLFLDSPTLGPKFSDLKKKWLKMDTKKYNVINFNAKKYKNKKFLKLKNEAIAFLKSIATKPVIRDDYKEIIELCLILLGERTFLGPKFSFKAPQGMSRARWMSKIIYGAKLFLFADQFSLTPDEIENLELFCVFTCLVYIKPWLTTCFPTEAATNDLNFIQNANMFKDLAPKLTLEVNKKFSRHSWYLAGNCLSYGYLRLTKMFLIYLICPDSWKYVLNSSYFFRIHIYYSLNL